MKMIMSFRPVCAVTLNAVFFLYKRKIIQSNLIQLYDYLLSATPPYRRRTSTQSDSSRAARKIWLPGTLREALPLSNYAAWSSFRLECHVLISVHTKVSGAVNNLSVTTTSLHLCSSFLQKVRTVMCLREVLLTYNCS